MVDYLTKWPQAYPLHRKSAAEVTECIIKFFHQFEAPKSILTDQRREFVNDVKQISMATARVGLCCVLHEGRVSRGDDDVLHVAALDRHLEPGTRRAYGAVGPGVAANVVVEHHLHRVIGAVLQT